MPEKKLEPINTALRQAHRAALAKIGFKKISVPKKDGFVSATTPEGRREFSPFRLELQYQPVDIGDTKETAVVGVSISGRYFPTFADWRDPSGTLTPVFFDGELAKVQKIARTEIVKAAPFMAKAIWIVKEMWY